MYLVIVALFLILDAKFGSVFASSGTVTPEQLAELRAELHKFAEEQSRHSDFVWVLDCIALVMFMQVGFLLVEAGFVRTKNTINVALKNFSDFFIAIVCFYMVGFTLMFSSSLGGIIGFDWSYISRVFKSDWDLAYFTYHAMFIGTAATIVSGAVAERMKFSSYCILTVVLSCLIYPMFGHWVWGNIFIATNAPLLTSMGFMDFAGGTVVHALAGWVSLAAIVVVGPRIGKFGEDGTPVKIPGHSMVLASTGALILFVGWIGFNAGSTRASSPDLALIMMNTIIAGSTGGLAAMVAGRFFDKTFHAETMINGVLAGLVTVTAGCNVFTPNDAAVVGIIGGIVCMGSCIVIERSFKLDDAIGAVSVHGVCGALGALLIPFFAASEKLLAGGMFAQVGVQLLGVGVCFTLAFGGGYMVLKLIGATIGVRVSEEAEINGLNRSEHNTTMGSYDIQNALLKIAQGEADLSTRLDEKTGDESADIAKLINPFLERFQELVASVSDTSGTLSRDLELISSVVKDSAESLKENSGEVEKSSLIVNASASTAAEQAEVITQDTRRIAGTARSVSTSIRELADVINNLSGSITSIDESAASADSISKEAVGLASNAQKTIASLSKAAQEIDSVVALIEDVQNKTNLLALNATIESERAGEYGLGFAVVAQEVKTLSQSAAGATDEIRKCLGEIRETSKSAADILNRVGETVGIINESVSDIRVTASRETQAVKDISAGVIESANNVVGVSDEISQLSDQVSLFSENVKEAADKSKDGLNVVACLKDEVANSLQTAQMVEKSSQKLTGLADKLNKTSGSK